ncbi:hypothetical protein ACVW0I_004214 [Bradyrhizobium sp. LM6.11]
MRPSDAGFSSAFGRIPQRVHLFQRRLLQRSPLRFQRPFDIGKAPLELRVGRAQRGLRVGIDMAGEVDQRKHQVAGFLRDLMLVVAVEGGLDFVGFLADFCQHRARVVPVEADGRGLALKLHGARQRRLAGLHA